MFTVEEVAAAGTASRAEFGAAFARAQAGRPPADRAAFEAVGRDADDNSAFRRALAYAKAKGFLPALAQILIDAGAEAGALAARLAAAGSGLHAMTSAAAGFLTPDAVARGWALAMACTAKIYVNQAFCGTGVLVSPRHVLTAWHVVLGLFQPAADGRVRTPLTPAPAAAVEFDNIGRVTAGGAVLNQPSVRVPCHAEPVVAHAACHPCQITNAPYPANLAAFAGLWDYAVLKLDRPVHRRHIPLDVPDRIPVPLSSLIAQIHAANGRPLYVQRYGRAWTRL